MMSASSLRPAFSLARADRSRLGGWQRISVYLGIFAQRRALARLDDAALNDIGVSREAAEFEAARPFWDLPARMR